jgi:ABC-type branched-subunit amino acid transport system ATPase component
MALGGTVAVPDPPSQPEPSVKRSLPSDASPVLAAEGITVRFGGLTALTDVDLTVPGGSVIGLIGPNGAGKSTLFAVLSGLVRPQAGTIRLAGREASGLSPGVRARLGLARTFQHPEVFATLTVREHMALAYRARFTASPLWASSLSESRPPASAGEEEAVEKLLSELGLQSVAGATVAGLPLGTLRRVEVGRALATSPSVLLLDEPSSGLDRDEAMALSETLAAARRSSGTAVVVVEHDVEFVMGLAEDVVVLDHGAVIARGNPETVRADPAVLEAYLGPRP